jgi:radical SAM protein (TIGR01212 family)
MYRTANDYYKEKYGCKVYKLSLDGGFTCPNRDGSVATGGCIFCSALGGGEFAEHGENISTQLEKAKLRVADKIRDGKYIAYFQSFTNTYAPTLRLKELFYEAIKPEYIVGLNIATRPDCLPDSTVQLLKDLNASKPVTVELGLQTCDDSVAAYINRGYKTQVYADAVQRLKNAGIEVITHIIIGLPNDDPVRTTRFAVRCGTDGVKFHLLHILKNTRLAAEYEKGRVKALTIEEYAGILKDCIDILPEQTVVHRITGDGPKDLLIAPLWSSAKRSVLNHIHHEMKQKNCRQGNYLERHVTEMKGESHG